MIDLSQVLALLAAHQYMLLIALLIGFAARMTKDDARVLPDIPARYRPLFVALLGIVAAGCDSVLAHTPWQQALATGLGAAVTAILGHVFGIEVLRGGKELPIGPLAKKPTDTSILSALLLALGLPTLAVGGAATLSGCDWIEQHPKFVQDDTQLVTCILTAGTDDIPTIIARCGDRVVPIVVDVLTMKHAAEKKAGMHFGADAGAAEAGAQ